MRLVITQSNPLAAGGVYVSERAFIEECKHRRQIDVHVVQVGRRSDSEGAVEKLIGRILDILRYAISLMRHRPHLVHLNTAFDRRALLRDASFAAVSRLLGASIFLKYHGSDEATVKTTSLFWRTLSRLTVSMADAVGVLSSEEKNNFIEVGYPPDKFYVVKNSVACGRFDTAPSVSRHKSILLFIGRFIEAKGLLDLIKAARILADAGRDFHLVCVGDGQEMEHARELVRDLELQGRLSFTGYLSEEQTTLYYLQASMLVFPTYHQEGFPMVLFQSAAAGLPIITTRIRAAADYLKEPDNCLWVEPRNPAMLAEKIMIIMDHAEMRKEMSRNNRALARKFLPGNVADEYVTIYTRLVGLRKSKGGL